MTPQEEIEQLQRMHKVEMLMCEKRRQLIELTTPINPFGGFMGKNLWVFACLAIILGGFIGWLIR